jgi:hypothetical protein
VRKKERVRERERERKRKRDKEDITFTMVRFDVTSFVLSNSFEMEFELKN